MPIRLFVRFANRPPAQTAFFTGVTVALVLAAFSFPPITPATSLPAPPAGWTTFHDAVGLTGPTLEQTSGGPWNLSLAEGVASESSWSPSLSMWSANATLLSTVLACQGSLSGPSIFTFWSSSLYPSGAGARSIASGAAGLWTFVYRNSAGDALVLSVLHGTLQVNGEVGPKSACSALGGPFVPTTSYLNPSNATDPTSFASSSLGWLRDTGDANGSSTTAYYILGNPVVPVTYTAHGYNQEWSTYYGQCGAPGVNGFVTYNGAPQSIPTRPGYVEELTFGSYCYQSMVGISATEKKLSSQDGTYYDRYPLILNDVTSAAGTSPPPLTTNLLDLAILLNSTNGPFSVVFNTGTPQCLPGAASLESCTSSTVSWYAVLLNPSGVVTDTFPSYGGGTNWTVPNQPIESGDSLAIVSTVPVFTLPNSGLGFISGLDPYVCCGMNFGPDSVVHQPVSL